MVRVVVISIIALVPAERALLPRAERLPLGLQQPLAPNLFLQLIGPGQRLFGCRYVWKPIVYLNPSIQVAPKTFAQRRLSVGREHVDPQISCADVIGFLDD
jgi:hypothetical protein